MAERKGNIVTRTARTAAGGLLGAIVFDVARKVVTPQRARQGAVGAAAWTLRGARRAEVAAEGARLTGADILAEARERNGEQSPAPGADITGHDHQH